MYKVLLADDEPMILRGLERLIDWTGMNVEIVGTAEDGQEAYSMIQELRPDIVISDINMPRMNGIELLKKLKNTENKAEVIFVSGYQEFDYARDALKYGAVDYIIKPINADQLVSAVVRIIKDKREQAGIENEPVDVKFNLQMDNGFEAIKEKVDHFEFENQEGAGYYAILRCDVRDDISIDNDEWDIIHFSIVNIIEELVEGFKGHWLIDKNEKVYVLFYDESKEELTKSLNTVSVEIVTQILNRLKEYMTVAVSKTVSDISQVREAYEMTNSAMDEKYFYGQGEVIYYNEVRHNKYTIEDLYKAQVGVAKVVAACEKNKLNKVVNYYMDVVRDVSVWNKASAVNYCLAAVVFIMKDIDTSYDLKLKVIDVKGVTERFRAVERYDVLREEMVELCLTVIQEVNAYSVNKDHADIVKVKKYLDEHYNEEIRLETLAELVYMNSNYFSGYFKKHVGKRFKAYLTDLRIAEAKKLLLASDKKIYEIAELVGFKDYRHFTDVFKKQIGESPTDYRNKSK